MSDLGFWKKKVGGSSTGPGAGALKVDVVFTTDNSGSMGAFQDWLFDPQTAVALNDALVENGIGTANLSGLDDDNANRIATSKYSEMLQLTYRDLIVVTSSAPISGISVGNSTVNIGGVGGYTVYAWNNRQFVSGLSTSNINTTLDHITSNGLHKYATGDAIIYNNGGGSDLAGLTNGSTYYVIKVSESIFRLANTRAEALAGTPARALTSAGSGSSHSFSGPFELVLRETAGAGSAEDIPVGSLVFGGGTVLSVERLSVPYTYYLPGDSRIKYFWASNNNGANFVSNTSSAGNATTPLGSFVSGIQEDSYNAIYTLYAINRNGGDDYRPRSGARGIVVASSNQQSILNPALPTTSGNSYANTLKVLRDNNVTYVGMVGGYVSGTITNRVEPYIRQAPDFGETGVPPADVRGFIPLTGEVATLDLSSQSTGILDAIPLGWYRNVRFVLDTAANTPNRIRSEIVLHIKIDAVGLGAKIVDYQVPIGGYGYEDGDVLTVSADDPTFASFNGTLKIDVATTEDEDYTGMGNTIIGGVYTRNDYKIIVMNGYNPTTGAGEAVDYKVRELNLACFPDTMLGETGSFNAPSTIPVNGYVDGHGVTLAADAAQYAKQLVLTSVSGITVGDYVYDTTSSNSTLRVPYETTVESINAVTKTITLSHPISEALTSGDTKLRVGPAGRDTFGWDYINLARETNGAVYFMPGPHNWTSADVIGGGGGGNYATNDWNTIAIFQTWKVTFGRSIGRVFGQYLFKTA